MTNAFIAQEYSASLLNSTAQHIPGFEYRATPVMLPSNSESCNERWMTIEALQR
jgi:hypothetical protein